MSMFLEYNEYRQAQSTNTVRPNCALPQKVNTQKVIKLKQKLDKVISKPIKE